MTFGDKLFLLRKKRGLSQEGLAEKIGVSRQAISRWEQGLAMPDTTNLIEISMLFEVSTDYLLFDEYSDDSDIPSVQRERKKGQMNAAKSSLIACILWCLAGSCYLIAAMISNNLIFTPIALLNYFVCFLNYRTYKRKKDDI
ncbi:MAG: helix-turn-helix transcriptional regulator [Firmicutes bacterium]|nr:helix-turn-helix transcriptional regulator [Bacillota bacterium]